MAKPLKIAGIFGIILFVLMVITIILSFSTFFGVFKSGGGIEASQQVNATLNSVTIILLISYLFSIGFLYGFVALGKRFNNKMLSITGWIFIVAAILGFILTLTLFATGNLYPEKQTASTNSSFVSVLQQKANQEPVMGAILNIFGDVGFLPLLILFTIGTLTLKITFGIGLYKLKKNEIALGEWAGSFQIGSLILGVLGTIAMIMETIIFFQASKKFE